MLAYRRERPARAPLLAAYALVGVAAVWSFETAFYTGATFAVTVVAAAWTGPDGTRVRTAATHLGAGAAAAVVAIAGLVAATRIGRGSAPDVGGYVDFLRLYSVDGFGQLPVPGWSLGYVMGGLYAASLAAVCTLVLRARAERARARLGDRAAGRREHARRRRRSATSSAARTPTTSRTSRRPSSRC